MRATFHQVRFNITLTGGTRVYSYPVDTPAEAVRKAKAEVAGDFGYLNVGAKVSAVQVWDYEAQVWVDVQEGEKDMPKALDQMTDDEKNAEISRMWADANGGEAAYYGFNGGGAASDKSKNYVRVLLGKNAGRREAELIRWLLNNLRSTGETITKSDVLPAIKVLKSL